MEKQNCPNCSFSNNFVTDCRYDASFQFQYLSVLGEQGGMGEVTKLSLWEKTTKKETNFWGEELTPLYTIMLVQKYRGLSPNTFYGLEPFEKTSQLHPKHKWKISLVILKVVSPFSLWPSQKVGEGSLYHVAS